MDALTSMHAPVVLEPRAALEKIMVEMGYSVPASCCSKPNRKTLIQGWRAGFCLYRKH